MKWGVSWWRNQMEIFSALLALCEGNPSVTGQRPVTRNLDIFFHLRLNKLLSKQSRHWCFETPSRSWWRHYNVLCDTCRIGSWQVSSWKAWCLTASFVSPVRRICWKCLIREHMKQCRLFSVNKIINSCRNFEYKISNLVINTSICMLQT